MADVADTLITKYVLQDDYSGKLTKVSQGTDSFAKHAKAAQSAIGSGGGGGLAGAFGGMVPEIEAAKTALFAVVGALTTVIATGVGLIDFGMKAMDTFAQYDSIERIFTGIYQSTKKAKEMMSFLNIEAQKGEFTFKDLATSATKLVMAGMRFSDFKGAIEAISLRAGGGAEKLAEVTDVLMRLKGGEMGRGFRTLAEMGIGKDELATLGATFDKSGEFVGNSAKALEIFNKLGEKSEQVAKAMEGSPAAMLSNIKEAVTRVFASVGEGLFNSLKGGIGSIVDELNNAIDSGVIAQTFQAIGDLFNGGGGSIKEVIASVLAGIQTAAGYIKMIWDGIVSILNSPITKALFYVSGLGLLYQLSGMPEINADMGKAYENNYQSDLMQMDLAEKRRKKANPLEPDNPNATASPVAAIAENTKRTAENTHKALDMARHVLGGGDLGRIGLTPVELDALIGHRTGARAGSVVTVRVVGSGIDDYMSQTLNQVLKALQQQGRIR